MSLSEVFAASWAWSWGVAFGALAALALFAVTCRGAFRRPGGVRYLASARLGTTLFLAAFVSPIGGLAEGYSFTAHMMQHMLLLLLIPLALVLAIPPDDALRWFSRRPADAVARVMARPIFGWVLALAMMWVWHAAPCCDAALLDPWVARLQYASLLLAGIVFWWKS